MRTLSCGCAGVCAFMCPRVGVDASGAVALCMQHAWRGRGTTLVHSSGVFPMLLETRSLTGQELHGRGRGQTSWPTSLLLPPLPGWDYRSMSPILASTLLAEPSPQLMGPFLKILSECHTSRIKI